MSSLIIATSSQKTMTSREIADLVESRHDNVKKAIDRCVEQQVFDIPQIRGYLDTMGRSGQSEYILGKRESLIVVSQMCPRFTGRIIDRWQDLEAQAVAPAFNIPTSLSSALRLAAEQAETIETQAIQLQAAKPAVEFVEKFVDSTGTKGFRQVCKLLNANEAKFRAFLSARQIMYQLGGDWVPYAHHIESGRMVVKAGAADSGHAFNSARFTTKGIEWVAGEFAKFNLHEVVAA